MRFFLLAGVLTVAANLAVTPTASAERDAFSQPASHLPAGKGLDFRVGRGFFRRLWVSAPASTQAADGLGPLYNARSCMACHPNNGRGVVPTRVDERSVALLFKVDVPPQYSAHNTDQYAEQEAQRASGRINNIAEPNYGLQLQNFGVPGHKAEAQLRVDYRPLPVTLADGSSVTLRQPQYRVEQLGYGPLHPEARLSPRLAPQLIGMGLLEAIPEAAIMAKADPQDSNNDGISGRANRVWSMSQQRMALGRFGHKAGVATVDEQSQLAFATDIGISTPLFPAGAGDCTPKQSRCLQAPNGNSPQYDNLEAHQQVTDLVALYVRHLAVPAPRQTDSGTLAAGEALFNAIGCGSCHTPAYDGVLGYPRIAPYTDLLLHDMGEGLADHRPEGLANGREWRTAPLWGIGLTAAVSGGESYLHDGRAATLLEAILWHGGEAQSQRDAVAALSSEQRAQLLRFIESL
jgi:CxxC motif-containing protein (DUF1111 family)